MIPPTEPQIAQCVDAWMQREGQMRGRPLFLSLARHLRAALLAPVAERAAVCGALLDAGTVGVGEDLAASVRALIAERDAALARLAEYGSHQPECEMSHGQTMRGDYTPTACTCGFVTPPDPQRTPNE